MSWLPARPASPSLDELTPWWPPAVRACFGPVSPRRMPRYLVVDELDQDVIGLVVTPWPHVDERGRVVFADPDEAEEVAVPQAALAGLLEERRVGGDAGGARPLSIGDVFAARVRRTPTSGEEAVTAIRDPETWLDGPVLDITADAREVAKMQASAAAAGALDDAFLEAVAAEQLDIAAYVWRAAETSGAPSREAAENATVARRRAPPRVPKNLIPPRRRPGDAEGDEPPTLGGPV